MKIVVNSIVYSNTLKIHKFKQILTTYSSLVILSEEYYRERRASTSPHTILLQEIQKSNIKLQIIIKCNSK